MHSINQIFNKKHQHGTSYVSKDAEKPIEKDKIFNQIVNKFEDLQSDLSKYMGPVSHFSHSSNERARQNMEAGKNHLDQIFSSDKNSSLAKSKEKSQNITSHLLKDELITQNLKIEKVLDKKTLDQRLEALSPHSLHKTPLFYWIDMPEPLTESGSSSVVSHVLDQLSKESSGGIKVLFNFPQKN